MKRRKIKKEDKNKMFAGYAALARKAREKKLKEQQNNANISD